MCIYIYTFLYRSIGPKEWDLAMYIHFFQLLITRPSMSNPFGALRLHDDHPMDPMGVNQRFLWAMAAQIAKKLPEGNIPLNKKNNH